MTTTVDFSGFIQMLQGAIDQIKEHHAYLSQLDAVIGDGDHGVSMLRAMKKLESIMAEAKTTDLKTLLNDMSWALLGIDGGATGPLMGLLFMGLAEGVGDKETLDGPTLVAMFEGGLASLHQQSKAQVGDKTMMDALIPAIEALKSACDAGADLETMFDRATEAAEQGAESTKEMVARIGRSKHQGERTLGHRDPGASSMALIFKGLRNGLG